MVNIEPDIQLFGDVCRLIDEAKGRVATAVNVELTWLYWQIGRRIRTDVLQNRRAEYGKQIISGLSRQLTEVYGRGWSPKQLHHCLRFAESIHDDAILSALRRQLG